MDTKSFSSTIAKFSVKFCNELNGDKDVVSSPLSAEYLLALIALGSTDTAHEELLTSLDFPDVDTIRTLFTAASAKLKTIKGINLSLANKIYVKSCDCELNPQLKKDAVDVFDAELEKVDFGDSAAAAKLINGWVESKTNERIKNLVSNSSLNSDTQIVLINALYFKGSWKNQFNPKSTVEHPFYINNETSVKIPMMYQEEKFKYDNNTELNAQILEMAYEGNEASMVIVLPNEIDGLDQVLRKLADGFDLIAVWEKLISTKLQVIIPKFKTETEIDLTHVFSKLGINAIFRRENSGVSKILDNNESLYISKAIQKAFIEVNEEGAEAAAATHMVLRKRRAHYPAPIVRADRPFLYFLIGPDHTMLFVGLYKGRT